MLQVLSISIGEDGDALAIAYRTNAKVFLTQPYCLALLDLKWRGGFDGSAVVLKKNFNIWKVAIYSMCPLLYLLTHPPKEEESAYDYKATAFLTSLSMAKKVADEERERILAICASKQSKQQRQTAVTGASKVLGLENLPEHGDFALKKMLTANSTAEPQGDHVGPSPWVERCKVLQGFYSVPAVRFIVSAIVSLAGVVLHVLIISQFNSNALLNQVGLPGLTCVECGCAACHTQG